MERTDLSIGVVTLRNLATDQTHKDVPAEGRGGQRDIRRARRGHRLAKNVELHPQPGDRRKFVSGGLRQLEPDGFVANAVPPCSHRDRAAAGQSLAPFVEIAKPDGAFA